MKYKHGINVQYLYDIWDSVYLCRQSLWKSGDFTIWIPGSKTVQYSDGSWIHTVFLIRFIFGRVLKNRQKTFDHILLSLHFYLLRCIFIFTNPFNFIFKNIDFYAFNFHISSKTHSLIATKTHSLNWTKCLLFFLLETRSLFWLALIDDWTLRPLQPTRPFR